MSVWVCSVHRIHTDTYSRRHTLAHMNHSVTIVWQTMNAVFYGPHHALHFECFDRVEFWICDWITDRQTDRTCLDLERVTCPQFWSTICINNWRLLFGDAGEWLVCWLIDAMLMGISIRVYLTADNILHFMQTIPCNCSNMQRWLGFFSIRRASEIIASQSGSDSQFVMQTYDRKLLLCVFFCLVRIQQYWFIQQSRVIATHGTKQS